MSLSNSKYWYENYLWKVFLYKVIPSLTWGSYSYIVSQTKKHMVGLVFHVRSQPVKPRYTNSQASKLMSMYHTHILHKKAFIFTHCKHTLFAVASLHKATFWGKITVLCKRGKVIWIIVKTFHLKSLSTVRRNTLNALLI